MQTIKNKTINKLLTIVALSALFVGSIVVGSIATSAFASPLDVVTLPATAITSTDATLNALNGIHNASGHSFWIATSTFSTASPTLPAGVYSTPDLGAVATATRFSVAASSISGLGTIMPNTTYYFAAWSNVGGTWFPGQVLSFTTLSSSTTSTSTTAFVTTNPATAITSTNATLNGMNGTSTASDHSFWVSTSTFSTASPTLPAGVYSTPGLGILAPNAAFSAPLNSATGLPAVTPNTTYYFATWANVGGTWHPGSVLNFTTGTTTGTSTGTSTANLQVTSVDTTQGTGVADGTFANGWKYVFHITMPTNETKLSMQFSDWTNTANSSTIPAANNMRISSAQADNGGATVPITAANTYSTPALNMTSDLDSSTPGRQVDVTVEVAIPVNSVNGSYSTNYAVQSLQ